MAKREVIDGTNPGARELVPYELPPVDDEVQIDLIQAETLEEVEAGIRSCERFTGALSIVQGVGILKAESMWQQSPYGTLQEYREHANERYGMSRQVISLRRKMARAWLDNMAMLKKIDISHKSIHLLYLEDALANHDKKEVIAHLKADSSREFQAWATKQKKRKDDSLPEVEAYFKNGDLIIDGVPVIGLFEDCPQEEMAFIEGVLRDAYRARKGSLLPHVVAVYDQGEARAVDNFLKKHRAEK